MKAYGRKTLHHNIPDNHPPKGYVNWWEVEMSVIKSKKSERRRAILEIEEAEDFSDDEREEELEEEVGKCEGCVHLEFVLNIHPYCRLYGKRLKYLTQKEKSIKCWLFDFEKEIQRIEAKPW